MMAHLRSIALGVVIAACPALWVFTRGLAVDASSAQSPRSRPDILIVLTDQQRADAFGAAGAGDVQTPTMDGLAREGVLFTRAFVATPQCSPSRAALLTARYPHRTRVMGNVGDGHGMSPPLDGSLATIGRVFAAAGYETAYYGKWHLGGTPGAYGFSRHNSTIGDRDLAREVVAFLQDRQAKASRAPLLLIVSWLNPHDIYNVLTEPPAAQKMASVSLPGNLADDLAGKPFPQRHYLHDDQGKPYVGADTQTWRRYRAYYNGLVETVDREIGLVLKAARTGNAAPITIFSSDHGDLGGSHGLPYKGPAMYEELVRVPLVMSWPGRVRAGRSDALVGLIDILPTLCDLVGLAAPADIDGVSLKPLLERNSTAVRQVIFSEYYGKQNWRVPIRMARTSRWKYIRYLSHGEELYDLESDPGELRNRAGDPAAQSEKTRLSQALDDWMRSTADPFQGLGVTDRAGKLLSNETR
jgi:arylsulfatase A-like enzyme